MDSIESKWIVEVLIDLGEIRHHDGTREHSSAHVRITIIVYPETRLVQKNDDHLACMEYSVLDEH